MGGLLRWQSRSNLLPRSLCGLSYKLKNWGKKQLSQLFLLNSYHLHPYKTEQYLYFTSNKNVRAHCYPVKFLYWHSSNSLPTIVYSYYLFVRNNHNDLK